MTAGAHAPRSRSCAAAPRSSGLSTPAYGRSPFTLAQEDFQGQERPDRVSVSSSCPVLGKEFVQHGRLEMMPYPCGRRPECRVDVAAQVLPKPAVERYTEASFRPVEHLRWKEIASSPFQAPLERQPTLRGARR